MQLAEFSNTYSCLAQKAKFQLLRKQNPLTSTLHWKH
jgi:ssDNA-specific exonuclease RecJ